MAANRPRQLAAALALLIPTPLLAQQDLPPQKEYYVGEGEVDLYRGTFLYSNTDITIGPSETDGGMALTRYNGVREEGSEIFGYSTTHSLDIRVYVERFLLEGNSPPQWSYNYHLVTGRGLETFEKLYGIPKTVWNGRYGGTFTTTSQDGPFIYTSGDGTVFQFGTRQNCPGIGLGAVTGCGVVNTITRPDGTVTSFSYQLIGSLNTNPRLRLVTNNRGFGFGFDYIDASSLTINRVCALNLASVTATVASPCPVSTPAATYAYVGSPNHRLSTYTNPAGQITTYTGSGPIATIRNPGSSVDDLTITYDATSYKVSRLTQANGAYWSYVYQATLPWELQPLNVWTEVTSPLGNMVHHEFNSACNPKPASVRDALNRTNLVTCGIPQRTYLITGRTAPEGNQVQASYDTRDNETETRRVAKSGSGLADIVTTATFPASCSNQKICNKPTSRTDPRGNVTDYTYDSTHGGVLTETGPAVNSVRPQKRFTYAQRYAWLKSGGGYAQAATPVWVLTEMRFCKTSGWTGSACTAGASDEVTTTYDYGPNSGPNNLLLRGVVVDSGGLALRTCYAYDTVGNKISETRPNANLGSCP